MSVRTTVVVGSGIAGVRFAQRLRARGSVDRIVVLGAEPHDPYERPCLSKQVLRGEQERPDPIAVAETDAIDLRPGVRATGVRIADHQLLTDAGDVDYDVLVIATGATPVRVPGVPGAVLRGWDDALALRQGVRAGAPLAVIGAGLIGCEVAASARAIGAEVHLVDLATTPMSRVLGQGLPGRVAELHEAHGVHLHLGVTAMRSATSGTGVVLTLSDGNEIEAGLLLHAVGIRPDTAWLAGTGLDRTSGVPCDGSGRAAEDVYAIGDVAAWDRHRAEHWTSAVEQADRVASALLGQESPPPSPSYWWSDQYDVKFQGLGSADGADEVVELLAGSKRRPLALYGRDGALIGAVGMSIGGVLMRLRADIVDGAPLAEVAARVA